jgi:SAM-dependent methyltransferase
MAEEAAIYISKENYITVHPEPSIWKHHANYHIMNASKEYIKGKCGDLGCNHGACSLLLLNFAPESIHGFDINIKALEVAYNSSFKINTDIPINFMCANLCKMPMDDNYFDFLMSFHTLEHIYPKDSGDFVSEAFRILKGGGYFLISIPYDHAYDDDHHVAFYIENSLTELFEKYGFVTIECFKDDRFNQKNLLTAVFKKPIL